MLQRLVLAALLLSLCAATAVAAPTSAKVAAISKTHLCLVLSGKPEAWMKKGSPVRALGGRALIVNVVPDTLCITSPNVAKTKVGATITLEKPRAGAAGC